jgi:hypothetical protein
MDMRVTHAGATHANGAGIDKHDDSVNMIRYGRKCIRLPLDMRAMYMRVTHVKADACVAPTGPGSTARMIP